MPSPTQPFPQAALEELSGLQDWRRVNGSHLGALDYARRNTTVESAVTIALIFWPDLIEYQGHIFLADPNLRESVDLWSARSPSTPITTVQSLLNCRHLNSLLGCLEGAPESERAIGLVIVHSWAKRLSTAYPNRSFTLELADSEDGPYVSFWEAGSEESKS